MDRPFPRILTAWCQPQRRTTPHDHWITIIPKTSHYPKSRPMVTALSGYGFNSIFSWERKPRTCQNYTRDISRKSGPSQIFLRRPQLGFSNAQTHQFFKEALEVPIWHIALTVVKTGQKNVLAKILDDNLPRSTWLIEFHVFPMRYFFSEKMQEKYYSSAHIGDGNKQQMDPISKRQLKLITPSPDSLFLDFWPNK